MSLISCAFLINISRNYSIICLIIRSYIFSIYLKGAGAKISIFGNADASSPFAAGENREDQLYSPYSPYGNGDAASYNERKGGSEEISFWKAQFAECVRRTEKVPSYLSKKQWSEITTELTRFTYNYREAMLRLAEASPQKEAANKAAKTYFSDLNDIFVGAQNKKVATVSSAYEKSLTDLAAFKSLL